MLSKKEIENEIKATDKARVLTVNTDGYGEGALMMRIIPGKRAKSTRWIASYMREGRQVRETLGLYPAMSPAEALAALRALVVESKKAPEEAGRGGSVMALFMGYLANLESRDARSVPEVRRLLVTGGNAAAEALGPDREASEVTPGDVSLFLMGINDEGKRRSAATMRTAMNAAFNWAINSKYDYRDPNARDWGVEKNPVAPVKKDNNSSKARDRNLSVAELKNVWQYQSSDPAISVLRLVILTGQRVLETLRIECSDIDFEEKVWNMPAAKTKGGFKDHAVPLCDQAVDLLLRLYHRVSGEGYLFPPKRRGASLTPEQEEKALPHLSTDSVQRITRKIPGVEPFQPRDLRRTWKSRAGDAGIDREIRDRLQQHILTDTGTKFYDHYDYLNEKREAVRKWGVWLAENVTG